MLTGGFSPCLPIWPIREIKLQGKYQNFHTDDLIVYAKQPQGDRVAKLLGQIKHTVKITKGDKVFGEVIHAASSDFNNKQVFTEDTDVLALITGPLSATDSDHVRALFKQAEHSVDADDFIKRVTLGKFTSNEQREKLDAFRTHLTNANQNICLTDDQLWRFLKSFHLLNYDLDIKGVTISLLHSLIGQYSRDRAERPVTSRIPHELVRTPFPNAEPGLNHQAYASTLVLANLLGSWNEQHEADKEIVTRLTGEQYSVWISKVRQIVQQPESSIALEYGVWSVTKREVLWHTLGSRVFDATLEELRQCAVVVLSECDPQFVLDPSERFAANIYGKVLRYSKALRKGISESLALLGAHSEALTNCSMNKPESTAIWQSAKSLRMRIGNCGGV